MFRSSAHPSKSKPCGFIVPCGRFKRTVRCQRSPGTSGGGKMTSAVLRLDSVYQVSEMCDGTAAVSPFPSANTFSTSNSKRVPRSVNCGRLAIAPTISMSLTSESRDSESAIRSSARHCAQPKPNPMPPVTASVAASMVAIIGRRCAISHAHSVAARPMAAM